MEWSLVKTCASTSTLNPVLIMIQFKLEKYLLGELVDLLSPYSNNFFNHLNWNLDSKVMNFLLKYCVLPNKESWWHLFNYWWMHLSLIGQLSEATLCYRFDAAIDKYCARRILHYRVRYNIDSSITPLSHRRQFNCHHWVDDRTTEHGFSTWFLSPWAIKLIPLWVKIVYNRLVLERAV